MRPIHISLIAALAVSCGGGAAEIAQQVIGPEGGTVAVSGGSGALDGFRIEVPAGAVKAPTTFTVTELEEAPALSELPPGFAAFNPLIRIDAEPAVSGKLILVFPIQGRPTEQDVLLTAFRHDDAAAAWVMVLPKAVEATELLIETGELHHWRWGFTLLEQARGASLEPTLIELYGETLWGAIKAGVEAEYEDTITPEVFDPENWSNCDKLLALNEFLVGLADQASLSLKESLSSVCGGCEVTVEQFMDELAEYIQARVRNFIVDLIVESCDLGFLMELAIKLNVALHYQRVIDRLQCDYECLFETSPPGMWGSLATYYIAVIADVLVYLGYLYDGCAEAD